MVILIYDRVTLLLAMPYQHLESLIAVRKHRVKNKTTLSRDVLALDPTPPTLPTQCCTRSKLLPIFDVLVLDFDPNTVTQDIKDESQHERVVCRQCW
ncbi:hypothetical protein KCU81_g159, partial [Aureobasidium melanogenum]